MTVSPEPDSPRVGIVDDDDAIRDLIAEVIADEGFAAVPWDGLLAPEEFVAREQPELLILDLRLGTHRQGEPSVNALLSVRDAAGGVPTIVCTADILFLTAHGDELAEAGFAVLTKPFELDDLLNLVDDLRRQLVGPVSTPHDRAAAQD
jgi:DNA-binding response OmpR family regulator